MKYTKPSRFLPVLLLCVTLLCACSSNDISIVDQNGKSIAVSSAGNDTYTFKLPGSQNTNIAWDNPFIDVGETNWFYDAVRYCYENELMRGTTKTTFSPQIPTSRAMIVSTLWRLEGSPEVGRTYFSDVADTQYYADAVAWAASQEIVSGYSEDTFCPDQSITREELAAILYRYAAYNAWNTSEASFADVTLEDFTDAHTASAYAEDALHWAYAQGILNGMEDRLLTPKGEATRAQVASILMRICETIASEVQ